MADSSDVQDVKDELVDDPNVDRGDNLSKGEADKDENKGEADKDENKGEADKGDADKDENKGDADRGDSKDGFIPRYRYNQVAQRAKELEEKLAALERRPEPDSKPPTPPTPPTPEDKPATGLLDQLKQITRDVAAAVKDGDADKVQQLLEQQLDLQEKRFQEMTQETASNEATRTRDEIAYDRAVEKLEADFPFLNQDNAEVFDERLANNIALFRNAFVQQGFSQADALAKAREQASPLIEMAQREYQATEEANKGGSGDDKEKPDPAKEREKAAKQRNAKAAADIPPDTRGAGKDNGKAGPNGPVDPMRMTEKEFDELPDEVLAQHRGDEI